MTQIGRRFGLSLLSGQGVFCSENGAFVGGIPLLELDHIAWRPRPLSDINRDLSKRYGLPVELSRKMDGLEVVASALGRGDVIYAQIATLHLKLPDPPSLTKSTYGADEMKNLRRQLHISGLLKTD